MAKPDLWCPKCKEFVHEIYEMLPDGEFYTSNRTWNGNEYEETDNSLSVAGVEVNTFCAKCHTKIAPEEMKYFLVHEEMFSADDSAMFMWLIKRKSIEEVESYYRKSHGLDKYDDCEHETGCGNMFKINSIREIEEKEFIMLSKWINIV